MRRDISFLDLEVDEVARLHMIEALRRAVH